MENFYINMLSWIRKRPGLEKIIIAFTKYFPYITFCIYPCVLIYLFITKNPILWDTFWRPLAAFLFVTIIRKVINRPRPYEAYPITPLVGHKKGESFPSRHTVSSMIIALVCFPIHQFLGIFTLIVAIILSVCRILCGVHYVSDVLVSVIIALFFYLI
ncbi:MAG: phosphatase PAP2 family protein [Coprobacillus cateniformis]|uniref:phosphatase PAP2 family protein n=1 Tax=Longibaculum muris TaxID=1796628 RepID=UPI003AB57403|nr:phosphatase PAP2 family protein [Coprobacillus cateniformis]